MASNKENITKLNVSATHSDKPLPKHELIFLRKKPQMGQPSITQEKQCSREMNEAKMLHLPWACSPAFL